MILLQSSSMYGQLLRWSKRLICSSVRTQDMTSRSDGGSLPVWYGGWQSNTEAAARAIYRWNDTSASVRPSSSASDLHAQLRFLRGNKDAHLVMKAEPHADFDPFSYSHINFTRTVFVFTIFMTWYKNGNILKINLRPSFNLWRVSASAVGLNLHV